MPVQRAPALVLNDPAVREALKQAWKESNPGSERAREQGGFIVEDSSGALAVMRWPEGAQGSIRVPAHPNCKVGDVNIVASFHTHPNTGPEYLQEPSATDRRAVRDDPDLKGEGYVGEFVMSENSIYLIFPTGDFGAVAHTQEYLA